MKYAYFFLAIFLLTMTARLRGDETEYKTTVVEHHEIEAPSIYETFSGVFKSLLAHREIPRYLTHAQKVQYQGLCTYHAERCGELCRQMSDLCWYIPTPAYRQNAIMSADAAMEAVLTPGSNKIRAISAVVSLVKSYLRVCYHQYNQLCSMEHEMKYHAEMSDFYDKVVREG